MFNTFPRINALVASIPSGIYSGASGHTGASPRLQKDSRTYGGQGEGGTKLVGYFFPHDTGSVVDGVYKNLVADEDDLYIYNSMAYNSGYVNGAGYHSETSGVVVDDELIHAEDYRLIRYFEADGTDDFLGPRNTGTAGYSAGQSGVQLNWGDTWTVCMWISLSGIRSPNEVGDTLFSAGDIDADGDGVYASTYSTGLNMNFMTTSSTQQEWYTDMKVIETGRWHFVAYEDHGGGNSLTTTSQNWNVYIDGRMVPIHRDATSDTSRTSKNNLYIGAYHWNYLLEGGDHRTFAVASAETKFGTMMIYSGAIGINRIQQNYIATRAFYNRQSGQKNIWHAEDPTLGGPWFT